ncbi:hypothetical protein KXQ82_12170 [Mucilaginibacter sp. HMF5004]|uniref:hypothetical protein n=1 Tax=Mucilaginibacter rivuli TaxID=2857527 RepID=UPI001C5FFEF7|nr:hypothetical protein [Mucilaginibacter rivuli]MBW4890482.1 hypothetical protein [Mucilaginibacter rivuli]
MQQTRFDKKTETVKTNHTNAGNNGISLPAVPVLQQKQGGVQPIQLKDKVDNPYPQGEAGLTAHHIIPQSVLTNVLNKLDPDYQVKVMANSLPDFAGLTLSTISSANITAPNGNSFSLTYRDNNIDTPINKNTMVSDLRLKAIATVKFSAMPDTEQAKISFDGSDWATFSALYGRLKTATSDAAVKAEGTVGDNADSDESKEKQGKLKDMYAAFYQWQSGNLFYGSKRYEEDSSDTLDEDEKYSNKDAEFSRQIKEIYTVLKDNEKALKLSPDKITEKINQLTTLTKNRAIAKYESGDFILISNTRQLEIMKGIGMANRMGLDKTGSSIHKQAIKDKIKALDIHAVLARAEGRQADWQPNGHPFVGLTYNKNGTICTVSVNGGPGTAIEKSNRFKLPDFKTAILDSVNTAMNF